MTEQAQDIVALLTESGVRTRRERAAFVAKLRDEHGLTFGQIGKQLNVAPQRAQQLYALHKLFQQSANSPFADLSTRARHFLNNLAHHVGLPADWEQHPVHTHRLVYALRNMQRQEALKFRNLGTRTVGEIEDWMKQKGISFMEAEEVHDLMAPASVEEAMQKVTHFLNEHGFRGQFKMWPKGTYLGEAPEDDFTLTATNFMGDAWEDRWHAFDELDALLEAVGLHYDVNGEPGQQRTFHFFKL